MQSQGGGPGTPPGDGSLLKPRLSPRPAQPTPEENWHHLHPEVTARDTDPQRQSLPNPFHLLQEPRSKIKCKKFFKRKFSSTWECQQALGQLSRSPPLVSAVHFPEPLASIPVTSWQGWWLGCPRGPRAPGASSQRGRQRPRGNVWPSSLCVSVFTFPSLPFSWSFYLTAQKDQVCFLFFLNLNIFLIYTF